LHHHLKAQFSFIMLHSLFVLLLVFSQAVFSVIGQNVFEMTKKIK